MLFHIHPFQLDVDSKGTTPWHRLAPQTRLLCALLFVFTTTLTPNGHWWTWAVYGVGLLALIRLSRVTLWILLQRVAIESTFLGVVLLGTLFRPGGRVLWQWGWIQITTTGLTVLASVSFKAVLCLLMMNLLVLTTAIPDLLHALVILRMPPLLVSILSSMYRYIEVLVEEFNRMRRAATSRNLLGTNHYQRLVVGNMIGGLFLRTFDRGERIHQAMLARGYTGLPPARQPLQTHRLDRQALTCMVLLAMLGQVIYLIPWLISLANISS